jgi:7,8-dihydropterin-6-yl-methyl-4-(beta-D-ribofuranosyl)aminobenzene 5'-phosphate synthase
LHNINEFDVEIEDIKKIIISHDHIENSGGLIGIYKRNPNIDIYVPNESFIQYNRKYKKAQVHGISDAIEIEPNIYTTGQIGNYIKEQSLLLRTDDEGLVLIAGCAHPGVEEFLFTIQNFKKYVKAIIGGFHSFRKYPYLEGVEFIGPCYCSEHSDEIQKRFPEQYQKICVGSSLCF